MDARNNAPTIDFAKMDGLVPGIVQDARTGQMLMLGFLNDVSYRKTLEGRDQRQPPARRHRQH